MPKTTNHTWDLSPLFKGLKDPALAKYREEAEKAVKSFAAKWKDRTDYLKQPAALKEALDDYEHLSRLHGKALREDYFLFLLQSVDLENAEIKGAMAKQEELANRLEDEVRFFEHKIARIPAGKQDKFLRHKPLAPYRHHLEKLFAEAAHLLSEPEEKILSLKASVAYDRWKTMVSGMLAKSVREVGGKPKSFSELLSLLDDPEPKTRDAAAATLNDVLRNALEPAEAEINAIVTDHKINDGLRRFPRPDSARHLSDDIDSEAVDALRAAVAGRFDVARRFYKLKAKLLRVPKLKYHERNVPVGESSKKYSYAESVELVCSVVGRLDPEFAEILESYSKSGQIDAFPRKGKRAGAFCAAVSPDLPTYLLLNHAERLSDVLTLAHELGHGINNEMMRGKQNALTFDTSTATAEVASIFTEDFVLDEILREADDEERLGIIMEKLNGDISSTFRQIALYEFEYELHTTVRERGYLGHEEIGKLFLKHMKAYMGPAVEQSPGSENWWVHWPHIRYLFYVYSYAGGVLISKALQRKVKEDPSFIDQVKKFLEAGVSESPRAVFTDLGIDITDPAFWNQGLDEMEDLLGEAAKLAKKLKKI